MRFKYLRSWLGGEESTTSDGRVGRRQRKGMALSLQPLEDRSLLNGYIATGSGPGAPPYVSIRVDILDPARPSPPTGLGQPATPFSDGRTDKTSQVFLAYSSVFLGGVSVAAGNFDGDYTTPDSLITAAGPGGGPHVIVWRMKQALDGQITTDGILDQFMAYDPRFVGGVRLTTGDLDGDGRAELIVSPGAGGGPHVKIYGFNPAMNKFVVKYQFMAYDPRFAGGVSISSSQGYTTPVEVRQVLNAQLPNTAMTPFSTAAYPDPTGTGSFPSIQDGFPLMGADAPFLGNGPSNTQQPGSNPIRFLPYVTVGAGQIQYLSGNLLNDYGNLAYEPNVRNPTNANPPNTQPLVFATWATTDPNRPAFADPALPAGTVFGPFVQTTASQNNNPARITLFSPPVEQVNARNQLVTGAGPGGGPHVKVYDFINDAKGFRINEQIGFMAFDISFRGGVNVAIGDVTGLPTTGLIPDNTSSLLEGRTFPYVRDVYQQFKPEITVSMATGGNQTRIYADITVDALLERRTSITQLNLQPQLLLETPVFDPNNPLGNYTSLVAGPDFNEAIDPLFRGKVYSAVSGLAFEGTGVTSLGMNIYAAGPNPGNPPNRGARVKIYNRQTLVLPGEAIAFDEFQAFSNGFFPGGTGGVSYGFGSLPTPSLDVVEMAPIAVTTIANPIFDPPPNSGGGGGGGGPPGPP